MQLFVPQWICAIVSLGLCVSTVDLAQAQSVPSLERFEFTRPEMGVPFRIVLYAPDVATAKEASDAAFRRVAQLNDIMSDYETDSELNELSRTSGQGKAVHASDDLWAVLECAQSFAQQSDGAFDITVGPVVSLWRKARREKQMPDPQRLADALKSVGYQNVQLNSMDHKVTLLRPGMKLDLGAIAKGYALNEALKVLQSRGVGRALVSGGGDLAIGEPPPGRAGWRIEVAPLDVPEAPPKQFVQLARTGLATSGDVFQKLEISGRRYSHIIDPHTGIGLTDHSLVTVIASNATLADALSTTVSVLGPEKGCHLISQIPGAAVHIVRKPSEKLEWMESDNFKAFYEPSAVESK